jgi:uncharacterized protein YjbI with pentapeptide repeats
MPKPEHPLTRRIAALALALISAGSAVYFLVRYSSTSSWLQYVSPIISGVGVAIAISSFLYSLNERSRERAHEIAERMAKISWIKIWVAIIAFAFAAAFIGVIIPRSSDTVTVKSILTSGIIVSIAAVIYVAWRRRHGITRKVSRSKRFIFSSAAPSDLQDPRLLITLSESLSQTSSLPTRIAALHALGSIAESSSFAAEACRDMLEVFVRQTATRAENDERSHRLQLQLAISELTSLIGRNKEMFNPPDLSGLSLDRLDLQNLSLVGVNLVDSSLVDADISGADLSGANLSNARLMRCTAIGTQFRLGVLYEADLTDAIMSRSNFSGALMTGATMTRVQVEEANFSRALLAETNLEDSNLTNADLQATMLVGAKLTGANLDGAKLSNVALSPDVAIASGLGKEERVHKARIVRNTSDLETWISGR